MTINECPGLPGTKPGVFFGLTSDTSVPIMTWLGNSVLVTVIITASRVFFDSLACYALSRLAFRGRGFMFMALLAVTSVPGVVLLVPKFLIVTYLGIFDTYTAMILPLMVHAAGIFIMKQFFASVSVSIKEAARMDGASVFQTFWSVVLPMARPSLITLTILSFQGSWNEFSHFLVVTQSPGLKTMVTGLAGLASGELGAGTQFPLKLCAALLTTIPSPRSSSLSSDTSSAVRTRARRRAEQPLLQACARRGSSRGPDGADHQPEAEDRHDRADDGPQRRARHHAA
jgi:multiple sugar transport system permease protein